MQTSSPTCHGCGQLIKGTYLEALNVFWHPEHFLCASCKQPITDARFSVYNDAPYHRECYTQHVLPRCAYCNKPLTGTFTVDYWGTRFCSEHREQYPRCAYCSRLIPGGKQTQTDGGIACPICRASAIETIEEARPLYGEVVRWLGRQGFVYNKLPLRLELYDRVRLTALLHTNGPADSLGATTSTTYTNQDGQVIRTEVTGVAVLSGLPATLFQGVTAHELGHVWLIVHGVRNLPPWAEEGFCELLSYRYYQELNTPESCYQATSLEKNPDPVYGEGLRRLRELVEQHGFSKLLNTLQTTKRLPTFN